MEHAKLRRFPDTGFQRDTPSHQASSPLLPYAAFHGPYRALRCRGKDALCCCLGIDVPGALFLRLKVFRKEDRFMGIPYLAY